VDWFRVKTWTKESELLFFKKLNKARKQNRAQYLKIQAIELIETKKIKNLIGAEKLLKKVLAEFPENRIEKSPTYNALGQIYLLRAEDKLALEYFQKSLNFENEFPNVLTNSFLDYSEIVIKNSLIEKYEFVEKILTGKEPSLIFPLVKYKVYAILAFLNNEKKNFEKAKAYKNLAIENSNKETSGLRYHKYLGIVKTKEKWISKLLNKVPKNLSFKKKIDN